MPSSDRKRNASRRNTVLVTGAGGFVGSAIVRALVGSLRAQRRAGPAPTFADGVPVGRVVAMLRPGGSTERLDELGSSDDWTTERADLTDPASLQALTQRVRPRAVLHAAFDPKAHSPLDEAEQRDRIDKPLEGLFAALQGVSGARIVTTGSTAVLRPGAALDENTPLEPNPAYLAYACHKLREEQSILRFGRETGVSWIHLRLFYLFGRYERASRLLPHLVRNLAAGRPVELSSGRQVRDYTDVDEVAAAYLGALSADDVAAGLVYHIGRGQGISIRDFAHIVAGVVGDPSLLLFGATHVPDEAQEYIVADPTRARLRLGWAASQRTDERIREAARWWIARARVESRKSADLTHQA
jgi:dTDP-6-deoxy-L-talose 4-dehydrogenase (NAD+)